MRDIAAGKNLCQHATARAVHGINRKFEPSFRNQIQIGKLADGVDVLCLEVNFFDPGRLAFRHRVDLEFLLNDLHDCRSSRTTKFSFELHAVPVPGIVTGGDHHPTGRSHIFHRI